MDYLQLLNSTIRLGTPIILMALGGLFALKVDVFNLALDAFALCGCFSSIVGAYYFNSTTVGIIFAILCTVILSLVYSFFVFELNVNAVVCAVALITLVDGLTRYLMVPVFHASGKFIISSSLALKIFHFQWLTHIPVLGIILNDHTIIEYLALIFPFILWAFLYKTSSGLAMRAIGSGIEVASSTGINVKKVRYMALVLNGIFCGLAGAELALSLNMFNVGMTAGRGFTALAVLILTNSEPIYSLLAGLLFGFSYALSNVLSSNGYPSQILGMLPYGLALCAAFLPSALNKIKKNYRRRKGEKLIVCKTASPAV